MPSIKELVTYLLLMPQPTYPLLSNNPYIYFHSFHDSHEVSRATGKLGIRKGLHSMDINIILILSGEKMI